MRRPSLSLRLLLVASVTSLVALVAAGLVISTLLSNFVEDTFSQTLDATMVGLMANVEYDAALGRPILRIDTPDPRFQQPFSGWYWTISDAEGVLFRSASLWSSDLVARGDSLVGPMDETLFARQRSFSVPGGTAPLQVIATLPQAVIDDEIARIVTPLILALVLLGVSLALAQVLQVHIGLSPLRRLGDNLGRIKAGDIDRLPAERYAELQPLSEQMNGLIAHNRETLRRARDHVGNLAHALKTPLAVIGTELGRPATASGRDAAIADAAGAMDKQIAHHLRRARMAGSAGLVRDRTDVAEVVSGLVPVVKGVHADRMLSFSVDIAPGAVFFGEKQDLEEMLGNLLDNACKWARSRVSVAARTDAEELVVTISDDGPGMDAAQLQEAGIRGRRFDETLPGTGLGLAIVKDIAGIYGGTLTLGANADTGLCATLRFPA